MHHLQRKLSRPGATGLFPRTRLFAALDRAQSAQVIWISSPGGSGKTALATSYCEARSLPCLWYELDGGDADPGSFFHHLALAWKRARKRKGGALPLFSQDYLQDLPRFTRCFFEVFYGGLPSPSLIVFDNYQETGEAHLFEESMEIALSTVPEGVTALVASRSGPPLFVSRLVAGSRAVVMTWGDLRLDREEAEGIIRSRMIGETTPEVVSEIAERARGWAAGVILLLAGQDGVPPVRTVAPSAKGFGLLFDYFACEVFERADPEARDFLLSTAFLKEMRPALCKRCTKSRDPEKTLADLCRRTLFLERIEGPGGTLYRYHDLFREFLLTRGRAEFPPEEFRVRLLRASEALEAEGCFEEAAALQVGAGHWEGVARIVRQHAEELVAQGRALTMESWLRAVPDDVLDKEPWLVHWWGFSRLQPAPLEARPFFERCFRMFRSLGDLQGLCLSWSGIVRSFMLAWGDFTSLDPWIREMEDILGDSFVFPSQEAEVHVVSCMLNAFLCRRGVSQGISLWAGRCRRLLAEIPASSLGQRTMLLNALLLHHNWAGDYTESALLIERFEESLPSSSLAPSLRLFLIMNRAFFAWVDADPGGALRAVEGGLALAESLGLPYWKVMFSGQGAYAALSAGDIETGERYLRKTEAGLRTHGRPLDISLYHLNVSWGAFLRGDPRRAWGEVQISLRQAMACGVPWAVALNLLWASEVLHATGNVKEASMRLRSAKPLIRRMGSDILAYKYLATRAYQAFLSGKEASGRRILARALALGKRHGYVSMACWRREVMELLAAKALEAGIEVDYVRHLIARRDLFPPHDRLDLEAWPYPVKIRTLGRFEILRDGRPIVFAGKTQRKPLELLRTILSLGGRDVDAVRLADTLWPDADGDLGHITLGTTLHRLRRLLGSDEALRLRDNRVSLDSRACWVDVWAFESLCARVDLLWERYQEQRQGKCSPKTRGEDRSPGGEASQIRAEMVHLAQKAMTLYGGHFLPGDASEPWTVSLRERLRSRFTRLVLTLGGLFLEERAWEKGAACFLKGIETDDLVEAFYRGLMRCYARLGDRAAGLLAYERCQAVLRANLGVSPSAATRDLHRALRGDPREKGGDGSPDP